MVARAQVLAYTETQGSVVQGRRKAGQGRVAQGSIGVMRTLRSSLSSYAGPVAHDYLKNLSFVLNFCNFNLRCHTIIYSPSLNYRVDAILAAILSLYDPFM